MADMTRVSMSVRGAEVVTVPIDDTLTIEGQAADAKATGAALALKADKSELQAAVKVNNQPADAQGLILIDGRHIPVSDQDAETLAVAVTDLKGKTAENIPMSSDSGAKTIAEIVNANAEAIENMEEMTGATMPIESGSQTTVKAAIEARVKTVNRKAPDADGDVDLSVVPLAENLQSDKMESVEGLFIIRTTGGSSSVSDGKAYPQHIMGTSERTGYVAEELNMTVIPIERTEPDEPITATIERDVFVAYVDESGTINLYYTTEWSEDPELYGVTVEGTPVAGDQIKIVYVKEQRGTIQISNPERLVGTGWNLFNFNAGYARVVRYSDEYGYKIGGAFTSIEFSATPEGDRVSILPGQNGLFQVPGDGYVFVNGGNATDTYILATWSDWTEGPATGYWEAYKESGIDLSAVMGTYFPYGMLSVGTIHDEIDLSAKRTISRVERMAYTAENLAAAVASGREYIYDTNYIYLIRAENIISAITIDTVYNVSEHGLEWFTGTTMPLITEILYGKNLRDKLERDVLTISQQTLAEEEKAQVRRNIGVMDPPLNGNGTAAQLLKTNGDGTTEWTTQGTPTDAQVGTAVSAWLTDHPEATTTVQDGAISRAKLNDDLKAKTDAVPELKSTYNESLYPILAGEFLEKSYTNPNGTTMSGATYGFKIPYPMKALKVTPSYSGHDGQITANRYVTTGVVEGASYTIVDTKTFNMGESVVFYDLSDKEFITLSPSNGYCYSNPDWPSSDLLNLRIVYLDGSVVKLLNPRYVLAGSFVEYLEDVHFDKIIGGIHNTNTVMSTAGTASYVSSDKNCRINQYYVSENTKYRYIAKAKATGGALICFYDENDTFLGYETALNSTLKLYDITFTTPSGCSYIKTSAYYPDFGILYAEGERQDYPYAGKLFLCLGDSRTWYDQRPYSDATKYEGIICNGYQHYLRELGVTTYNLGSSGYTAPQNDTVAHNYTIPTTADYFIIWTGVNDWQKGVLLGTIENIGSTFDTTKTAGAYQDIIEYIINTNPNAKIFIMGNYECWNNNLGVHEPPEMDDLIHSICDLYAIPFLDLLHESRINILNRDNFFADAVSTNVYLHLSNAGYEYISNTITKYIGNN